MRRFTLFVLVLALGLALVAPAAAADTTSTSSPAASATPVAFCRSTDRLLRFVAHAPDPRKLAGVRGRRILDGFRADAPTPVRAASATVADSFAYLSRHGAHTLSKARDARTSDALLRTVIYAATRCSQRRIRVLAQGLTQRRFAQAEAARKHRTTTTSTP
jgi:hypothetical protein